MRVTLAAILCMTVGLAAAGDLPRYDTSAFCKKLAAGTNGEARRNKELDCATEEGRAAEFLRTLWPTLAPRDQATCADPSRPGRAGSYVLLQGCVAGALGVIPQD